MNLILFVLFVGICTLVFGTYFAAKWLKNRVSSSKQIMPPDQNANHSQIDWTSFSAKEIAQVNVDENYELLFTFINLTLLLFINALRGDSDTSIFGLFIGAMFLAGLVTWGAFTLSENVGAWLIKGCGMPFNFALRHWYRISVLIQRRQRAQLNEAVFEKIKDIKPDLQKLVKSFVMVNENVPKPFSAIMRLSQNQIEDVHFFIQSKGFTLTADDAQEIAILMAHEACRSAFEDFFKKTAPKAFQSVHIDKWAEAYIETFRENRDYLLDLQLLMANLPGAPFGDLDEISPKVLKAYSEEILRRRQEMKMSRIQKMINTGRSSSKISIETVDRMDGHQFEKLLEHLYAAAGYSVAPTRQTSDQGADLIIEMYGIRTVVQAKRYSDKVGNSAIQEVVAAKAYYKCQKAVVCTNNYFTKPAVNLAKINDVTLVDREELIRLLEAHELPSDFLTLSA